MFKYELVSAKLVLKIKSRYSMKIWALVFHFLFVMAQFER